MTSALTPTPVSPASSVMKSSRMSSQTTEEDKLETTGLGNGPTADGDEEAENDE